MFYILFSLANQIMAKFKITDILEIEDYPHQPKSFLISKDF